MMAESAVTPPTLSQEVPLEPERLSAGNLLFLKWVYRL